MAALLTRLFRYLSLPVVWLLEGAGKQLAFGTLPFRKSTQ
jgi:hypothetical protein